ncbi:MAG: endonuclease III [Sphingobacteriales bacterium]|nr:MAG: endonuclease III [Sphingobacteriales bacterium]
MTQKQRYQFVLNWFREHQPVAETELGFRNPYELIVAVILSAQCTDKRVNLVTPALFEQYPTPEFLAKAEIGEVFECIKSVSFANNKTRHLIGMAQRLCEHHNSEVPQTMEELILLPGVGRKTANVVLSVAWGHAAMAVDTHVFRVSARIGLTKDARTPDEAERQLVRNIPEAELHKAHHWLILHGRYICIARRPKCEECALQPACAYFQKEMKDVVSGTKAYDPERDAVHKIGHRKTRKEL